jgi:TolA-binding protein
VWARLVENYPLSNLTAEISYQVAEYFLSEKNYPLAQKVYTNLRNNYPNSEFASKADMKLAEIQYALGNFLAAVDQFSEIVKSNPSTEQGADAQYRLAECCLSLGKPREAIENFQKVVDNFVSTAFAPKAQSEIAKTWESMQEKTLAQKACESLLAKFPKSRESAEMLLAKAKEASAANNLPAAMDSYRQAADAYQGEISAEAQKRLADCYYQQGSYKEATVEYLKTAYLFRNYPEYAAEAQFLAGKSCEAYKQLAEAKNAYKRTKEFFATTLWAAEADKRLGELQGK